MKIAQICKALIYISKMLTFQIEKMIERTRVLTTEIHYTKYFNMEQEYLNYHFE